MPKLKNRVDGKISSYIVVEWEIVKWLWFAWSLSPLPSPPPSIPSNSGKFMRWSQKMMQLHRYYFLFRLSVCLFLYISICFKKIIYFYTLLFILIFFYNVYMYIYKIIFIDLGFFIFHQQRILRVSFFPGRGRVCSHCWICSCWPPIWYSICYGARIPCPELPKWRLSRPKWRPRFTQVAHRINSQSWLMIWGFVGPNRANQDAIEASIFGFANIYEVL